jgi:CTP synthase (UTP-ammonia lyase)
MNIGLVGDYDASIRAHQAIPEALRRVADALAADVSFEWLATESITRARLLQFDGLWCVPGSPYRSMEGALQAIRFAREEGRPYLGTCGGFQHAVIEYARHVLGWADAEHAETAPDASRAVISLLECALVEATDPIVLVPGTRIHRAYGTPEITEGYHCRYGMNAAFLDDLTRGTLRISARSRSGEVRAVELPDHPFFVATLFQPERAALAGAVPPLVRSFVEALYTGRGN